jgi:hypothetical protein
MATAGMTTTSPGSLPDYRGGKTASSSERRPHAQGPDAQGRRTAPGVIFKRLASALKPRRSRWVQRQPLCPTPAGLRCRSSACSGSALSPPHYRKAPPQGSRSANPRRPARAVARIASRRHKWHGPRIASRRRSARARRAAAARPARRWPLQHGPRAAGRSSTARALLPYQRRGSDR